MYSAMKLYILSGIGTVRCPCTVLGDLTKVSVSVKVNALFTESSCVSRFMSDFVRVKASALLRPQPYNKYTKAYGIIHLRITISL